MRLEDTSSFASEHTVEYAAVKATDSIFRNSGLSVFPVFFWKSREGGVASKTVHADLQARLFAVFPRRPRVYGDRLEHVGWKVNGQLMEFAEAADVLGVPTFAALPLARNLVELSRKPPMRWISLQGRGQWDWHISKAAALAEDIGGRGVRRIVLGEARIRPWPSAIDAMDSLRSARRGGGLWFGLGGYKPVYFLCVA